MLPSIKNLPIRRLGKTNLEISAIGCGTASFGSVYGHLTLPSMTNILKYALNNGINIIDTAPYYGDTTSETNLGNILHQLSQTGEENYKRSKYILTSKIGRYGSNIFDFSTKRIQLSIEESLNRLQTDYIDIVHVHDPEFIGSNDPNWFSNPRKEQLRQIWEETFPYLLEMKNSKKINFIGLSGRNLIVNDYIAKQFGYQKIDTFLTYNNYNIHDMKLLNIMPRLKYYDIGIIQGGSTHLGLLTPQGSQEWELSPKYYKDICANAVDECAKKYGGDRRKLMELCLKFIHKNSDICTILVGPVSVEQMQLNIEWIGEALTEYDWEVIQYLQNTVMVDIMNIGIIESGTERNIAEAAFNIGQLESKPHGGGN